MDWLNDAKRVDNWLGKHAGKGQRVLVFIHGFNTRFEGALFSFAQILHGFGADAAPDLFSWPSRGSLFEYSYDRESAKANESASAVRCRS